MSAANMSGSTGQEERESLLSAMYDGEASAGECDLVARRLARDPALRQRWSRYSLAGAVLRGDRECVATEGFARRLAAALADEPAFGVDETTLLRAQVAASRAAPSRSPMLRGPTWARWRLPAAGAAVAASVALATILVLRAEPGSVEVAATGAGGGSSLGTTVVPRTPDSYIVPSTLGRDPSGVVPAAQLANYVVAHSEYSNPLGRRNLLSALMAGESFGNGSGAWPASGPDRGSADGSSLDEPAGAGDASR
jgi:sigma-E factor negative regulatory protein RseA